MAASLAQALSPERKKKGKKDSVNYDRKSTLSTTTFTYSSAGRVSGVIRADTTTESPTA